MILALAACVLAAGALPADELRLAVSDLAVHSDNPQYRYLGKGIAEMIAAELRKAPQVTLIEREKRAAVLEEIEFSLSDLADSARQAEVGRLLAAGHMVFGELIDMGGSVLVSLRLVEAQTGQVAWNDTLTESLARYDYIAGYFASSLLGHFGLKPSPTTAAKLAGAGAKQAEAVIALSQAVDSYDRNDQEQARRQLGAARRYDPQSEAAAWLLARLAGNSTRFKVLMEQYYSYLNPAFLGVMERDLLHLAGNTGVFPIVTHVAVERVNYTSFGADSSIAESDHNVRIGYALPLGRRWGLRVDLVPSVGSLNRGWTGAYDPDTTPFDTQRMAAGAVIDVGFRAAESLALGAGVGLFSDSESDLGPQAPFVSPDKLLVSGNFGLLYRNPGQTLLFDSRLGFSNQTYDIADPDTLAVVGEASAPVYWENTLSLAYQQGATFLIFKQINSFSLDRSNLFFTLLPAVERRLAPWVSLRAGLEGSLAVLDRELQAGFGVLAGVSLRSARRGFEADLNLSWRQRPSRVVEGLLYTDLTALVNLTWDGLWVSRQPPG